MKINKTAASILMMSAISLPAAADDVYYDTARVISVAPQVERINVPREECHTEYTRETYSNSGSRDIGGAIIGGIAGGLLGSQIGKGSGRVAGAAVGAATGAIVGDRIDNSGQRSYGSRPVERCVTVAEWQTVTRNYLVTYRYDGREYTTVMSNDPGRNIRVRVAITPDYDERVSYLAPEHRDNGWHRGWDKRRGRD
ncbi:MAG: glycine zipper 2TM domain-containing protein [Methylophilaceae bacterium]